MKFDVNGYDTRRSDTMDVYLPRIHKDIYKNSHLYAAGVLWNALPEQVKIVTRLTPLNIATNEYNPHGNLFVLSRMFRS